MKKFIAMLMTATILLGSTAMILAENGKPNSAAAGASEKFQTALLNREENMVRNEATFEALKAKVAEKQGQIAEQKARFKTKQEEFQAFKEILFTKRSQMLAMRSTANKLHVENAKLMGDVRNSLGSLEEKGIVLSEETKLALADCTAQIKEITAKIRETKGQIQNVLKNNRGFINNRDYVSMEAAFDEIFAIEQFRNECLTQINTMLQDIIKLLVAVV